MKFQGFLHLNIRASKSDLPAIEKFYGDVLGLNSGDRPAFMNDGLWLYDGADPIVHVSARFPEGSIAKSDKHTGSVDHIAFKASGAADFRKRLKSPTARTKCRSCRSGSSPNCNGRWQPMRSSPVMRARTGSS